MTTSQTIGELRLQLKALEKENELLRQVHQLDLAEIVQLRRMIQAEEERKEIEK